jgi:uncharacterized protein with ATP-grasp and redox domains
MKTYTECIPCFLRQALQASRFASDDPSVHERVLREVARAVSTMDMSKTPPEMGQLIHRVIRKETGIDDPYAVVKRRFNDLVLELYPRLKDKVAGADDPFETAVRLAIAGNIIDFGGGRSTDAIDVERSIGESLTKPLAGGALELLRSAADEASDILYIADNAGEIVFDRILIEELSPERVTLVVRGRSVLNDATIEDAGAVGLLEIVDVLPNGSDAPGTILDDCSEAVKTRFAEADLVIAKGQGNFETLSNVSRPVFFLLRVKCEVLAREIGYELGSVVVAKV